MNFSIGLTGLQVAQQAIDLVGTNIANATTEGYHKQEVDLASLASSSGESAGVEIVSVSRDVDTITEAEILRRLPTEGQVDCELSTLETIEAVFGDLDSDGLGTAIDDFFNSLSELSVQPDSAALQTQVVNAATAMAEQFNSIGSFLEELKGEVKLEAQTVVDEVNSLAIEVADLNTQIAEATARGVSTNILEDQRDQCLTELATLSGATYTQEVGENGMVNVTVGGIALVTGGQYSTLSVGITDNNQLGLTLDGGKVYSTDNVSGTLGGLMNLYNDIIPEVANSLDALASAIIDEVNALHVQGVGESGSFTELTGEKVGTDAISEWSDSVTDGSFYIRVTNTETGEVTRYEIEVDTDETISDVADKISALTDADGNAVLSASVVDGALCISVVDDDTLTFDFLATPLVETGAASWTGSAEATASGSYEGDENDVLTATVVGTGTVGQGDLSVEIRNQAGDLIDTVNVGDGYSPGDDIELANGVTLSLSTGSVNDGDTFEVAALALSDTSGLLAAAGLNTFFDGDSAMTIAVSDEIADSPSSIAYSLGADGADNENLLRMAEIAETSLAALNGDTPFEAYTSLVTDIGQEVSSRESKLEAVEAVLQQLEAEQDETSGVDVNEEAAKLLVYERMFQMMSKFLSVQNESIDMLADIV